MDTHSDLFSAVTLSAGGRPQLEEGELELKCTDKVRIETDRRICVIESSTLIVTNMRLILQFQFSGLSKVSHIHLKLVSRVEDCATMFRSSMRLRLHFHDGRKLEFKFFAGGKEATLDFISKMLLRQAWIEIEARDTKPGQNDKESQLSFSSRSAGVSGLLRRQEKEHQNLDAVTRVALTDLDALMNHAKEVVGIIEKYAAVRFNKSDDQSDTTSEIGDATEMEAILQNIGIVSPVTKLSAGRMYHEQLARQITDLLLAENRIRRLGGMVTLADVYCLYNKARGTELVSPDDTLAAAELLEGLRIGLKLRKFESGVFVLQEYGFDDTEMFHRIKSLALSRPREGISPAEVSRALHMSLIVSKEQILLAEQNGFLCRDDTVNGIFFFVNKFNDSNAI